MNALQHEPHTWLCKIMGLKTYTSDAMEGGKTAHAIVQTSVSSPVKHKLLTTLPDFANVEREDFDPKMRIQFDINDKYVFNGFMDADNPSTLEFAEFKFGKRWSPGDFAKLAQWKLYAVGKPDYKKVWFVNAPIDPNLWNQDTVRIFNIDITPKHLEEAKQFIEKSIYIIDHIKEQELHRDFRSRWCYYIDCPYCGKGGQQ